VHAKFRAHTTLSALSGFLAVRSHVTGSLPERCTPVTYGPPARCSLSLDEGDRKVGGEPHMPKQSTHNNKNKGLEGGHYARTEEELYKKAIALLQKCKVENQR